MQGGEAELLFNHCGFITPSQKQVDELTVCPWLRYFLTYGWPGRKGLTCFHPGHLRKCSKEKCLTCQPGNVMKHRLFTIYTEFPENLDRMFQTGIRVPFLQSHF